MTKMLFLIPATDGFCESLWFAEVVHLFLWVMAVWILEAVSFTHFRFYGMCLDSKYRQQLLSSFLHPQTSKYQFIVQEMMWHGKL